MDTIQEPLVVLDKDLVVVNVNPAFLQDFRVERDDTLGKSLFELGNVQWDIADLRGLLEKVVPKSLAVVDYEVRHDFPDLGSRIMCVSARRLSHPDHNSTHILVVFKDITESRKADSAKDILVAETQHRMKNLMAMVRGVANQTRADGLSGPEYRDVFLGRFEAVLTAQEFITVYGENADLSTLMDQTLTPIAQGRAVVAIEPFIVLRDHQVLPVSMVVHELATNAMKYGALSTPEGRVHLSWNEERRHERMHLVLDWREEGEPPVVPPKQRGFGTRLIDHNSKSEGGDAELRFEPGGLHAKISFVVD